MRAIILIGLIALALPAAAEEIRVSRVIDGDTFEAANGARIRLCGIDAPEKRESGGSAATEFLRSIIAGQALTCAPPSRSRLCKGPGRSYGRKVMQCRLPDGRDVSALMVSVGHARWAPKYLRQAP